jgi:SPOR domain
MTTKTNESQQNKDFGLPQVEFKPIEAGIGTWIKITAIIVGFVLLIGAGFVYWFFYHAPTHDDFSMGAQPISEAQESNAPKIDIDTISNDASTKPLDIIETIEEGAKTSKLTKAIVTLTGEGDTKNFSASHATPEKGTITRINTPQGFYYVVVGSFIDEDLASDYANKLAQQGVDVMYIVPPKGQYYSRIAITRANTFRDAHEKAAMLKATYGADIWVMKY